MTQKAIEQKQSRRLGMRASESIYQAVICFLQVVIMLAFFLIFRVRMPSDSAVTRGVAVSRARMASGRIIRSREAAVTKHSTSTAAATSTGRRYLDLPLFTF